MFSFIKILSTISLKIWINNLWTLLKFLQTMFQLLDICSMSVIFESSPQCNTLSDYTDTGFMQKTALAALYYGHCGVNQYTWKLRQYTVQIHLALVAVYSLKKKHLLTVASYHNFLGRVSAAFCLSQIPPAGQDNTSMPKFHWLRLYR